MNRAGRLDYIDAVRGIAALMVVVQHAAQITHQRGNDLFLPFLETVNLGRFGVVLFFLISGFVIPFSFRGETPMRGFAISRFFRLYPAYWLSLFAFVVMFTAMGVAIEPSLILANLTMIQGSFGLQNIGFGYWTLNVEMGFYAICMLLFWRGKLEDTNLIGTLVVASLAIALSPYLMRALTGEGGFAPTFPFYLALFFTGLLLRRSELEQCAQARVWAGWLVPVVTIAGLTMSGWIVAPLAPDARYLSSLPLGLAMSLPVPIFAALARWHPAGSKPLLYLGAISYSVYLFQDLAIYAAARIIDPGAMPLIYVALVVGMSVIIAMGVYRFVERPSIAIGRRLTARPQGLPSVQAAP